MPSGLPAASSISCFSIRARYRPQRPVLALGSTAFVITLTDPTTGNQVSRPLGPLALDYQLTPARAPRAGGELSRVKVASWTDNAWVALPCSIADATLDCAVAQLNLFAVVVAPAPSDTVDMPLENGWFYREADAFGGAGDTGYAVVDDDAAAFWTEFQRLGGADRLGYPISKRFEFGGYPTQAFQKLVLQWRPALGQAVSLDILDAVATPGETAGWRTFTMCLAQLQRADQSDMGWDEVVDRHLAMLDPYPALGDFYASDPDALNLYGLPMTLEEDGPLVTVRLQRGVLQVWTTDMPWAAAGTVVVDNAADYLKATGVWPTDAVTPGTPPPGTTADSLPEPPLSLRKHWIRMRVPLVDLTAQFRPIKHEVMAGDRGGPRRDAPLSGAEHAGLRRRVRRVLRRPTLRHRRQRDGRAASGPAGGRDRSGR